jgi:hypothetical protein
MHEQMYLVSFLFAFNCIPLSKIVNIKIKLPYKQHYSAVRTTLNSSTMKPNGHRIFGFITIHFVEIHTGRYATIEGEVIY